MQNAAGRVMLRVCQFTPTIDMHLALGLERLDTRRDMHVATRVYMGLHDLTVPFINDMFTPSADENANGRVTRSQTRGDVVVPQSLHESGERRFEVRGGLSWNNTLQMAKDSPSLSSFKRNIIKTGPVYIANIGR